MARTPLKPPFAYYGGKTTLAPKIAEMLLEHDHYVEPFAGSLAVLLAKDPSKIETVNDLDGHIVTFWRALRERADELERVCALTPYSRAEFEQCKSLDGDSDLEVARQVWVVLTQGRRKSLEESSAWITERKATVGISRSQYLRRYIGRFADVASRLGTVAIESRDALVREQRPVRADELALGVLVDVRLAANARVLTRVATGCEDQVRVFDRIDLVADLAPHKN